MTCRYQLQPFSDQGFQQWSSYTLLTEVSRDETVLNVSFQLEGNLLTLKLPELASSPQRQDHLWEATCFEVFFGKSDHPEYWEVNLSPNHHWNVYRFSNYRTGMIQEDRLTTFPCQQARSPSKFFVQCQLPLDTLTLTDESIELNVTTVLQAQTGEISYWAVTHAPHQADFHDRPSFSIEV